MDVPISRNFRRGLACLACTALFGGLAWLIFDLWRDQQIRGMTDAHVQEIISMLDLEDTSTFHRRIDSIRIFVNDHSTHKIDQAFRANQGNSAAFAAGVAAHAKRLSTDRVHMECSTRSNLMASILNALGYETRIVAVFDSDSNLRGHSFLEVRNPETKRWETQDPDYDIYWRRLSSNERASLAAEAEKIDDVEPCGRESCGWRHVSREGIPASKIKGYLDIISITSRGGDLRYALYTSRADLTKVYTKRGKKGVFCEVESKRCKQGLYSVTEFGLARERFDN